MKRQNQQGDSFHPQETKNVCTTFHMNPSIHPLAPVQSMWTKEVDQQTLASIEELCQENIKEETFMLT